MRSLSVPAIAGTVVRAADRPGLAVSSVLLRPLAAGDTGTVERVFAGLSARSRQLRFLAPVAGLSQRFLRHLADVDHDRHGCWVAVVDGRPVGLGRYVLLPGEPGTAEIAVEVVDAVQDRGLGTLLLDVVSVAAADAGATRLLWVLDPANSRVRHRARQRGARFTVEDGVLTARTDLSAVPGLDAAAVVRLARAARAVAGDERVPAARRPGVRGPLARVPDPRREGTSHDPAGSDQRPGPGRARPVQPGDPRRRPRVLLRHRRHRPATGTVPDGIEAQTEQALQNLAAILASAGASMADLVKVTIFYADVEDFARLNEVYARHMPDPPPARSAPANVALPHGLLVSIDAIAAAPARTG